MSLIHRTFNHPRRIFKIDLLENDTLHPCINFILLFRVESLPFRLCRNYYDTPCFFILARNILLHRIENCRSSNEYLIIRELNLNFIQYIDVHTYLFWNQTWTTRMSSPVSWESCSRTCLAGLGLVLYANFKVSNCFAVIVVLGLLFGWSPSILPPSANSMIQRDQ